MSNVLRFERKTGAVRPKASECPMTTSLTNDQRICETLIGSVRNLHTALDDIARLIQALPEGELKREYDADRSRLQQAVCWIIGQLDILKSGGL